MKLVADETVFPKNISRMTLLNCQDGSYYVHRNEIDANFSSCAINITQNENSITVVRKIEFQFINHASLNDAQNGLSFMIVKKIGLVLIYIYTDRHFQLIRVGFEFIQ